MHEKENIMRIFWETRDALAGRDSAKIKSLSDQTINTASLTHDPDNIAVAVIVYSLSKILERDKYKELPGWDRFYEEYTDKINDMINALKKDDEAKIREDLEAMRRALSNISGKLKSYIQDVFRKAKINKASRIYEHGISMEKTAKLLGITMYELASYSGQKGEISEGPLGKTMDVKKRIKIAEEMFG